MTTSSSRAATEAGPLQPGSEAGPLQPGSEASARAIPTTCIETIGGDPNTALRLSFQIKVF